MNRPIEFENISANRAHVKFGRRFRHVRSFMVCTLPRKMVCMSKLAVVFDMHSHFGGVKVRNIPAPGTALCTATEVEIARKFGMAAGLARFL